jgi:vitamin B12 transporter
VAAALLLPVGSLPAAEDSTELETTIVTATRTAQTVDESLASVTVIDRAEIERREAISVPQVLRGVPGLSVSTTGGLGKSSSVFLRGTSDKHVLVLIDGVRVGSATLGTAAFQDLPIDQIERIEIVRGPRASLYGSDAVGGVIQIFTRKSDQRLRPFVDIGGGSHATYKLSGGLSGGTEQAWYSLSASHLDSAGFNSCKGFPFPIGGGCFTDEPDDDGYRNSAGNLRVGYLFDNGLELEGRLLHVEAKNEYDGSFVNRSDVVQQVASGQLKYSPTKIWAMTLTAGRNLDESQDFKDRLAASRFDTQRVNVTLQNDVTLAEDHLLTLGLDYYNDSVSSTVDYNVNSRDNKAGFAQYQGRLWDHEFALGMRHDDNEQFGGRTTGNVSWGYAFGSDLRLRAAWGTGFKAPTFNELYFPGFGTPTLQPEDSESWEIGANGERFGLRWSVSGYRIEIDDAIVGVSDLGNCPPPFFFCARNIQRAEILGLETTLATTFWGWDIAANVSILRPESAKDDENAGKLLPRRAETMFRVDLDRAIDRFTVGATLYGEGRRFEDLQNAQRLTGYVTIDLRAGVRVAPDLNLEARVSNLLDKDYETARFYNEDGRNYFVTLRYAPK